MKKMKASFAFLIGSLILLAALSPALATTPQLSSGPRIRTNTTWLSTNWSGYAVTGSTGTVTSVSGSWTVPLVTGSKRTTAYSSFWVGIDGFNTNTVEQIGTDSDIQNGKAVYYAWYEFYPNPMVQITSITVSPGDTISASVTYSPTDNTFTVSITDKTQSWTSPPTTVSGATESSAEWIAEAPSSLGGVLPLADFGRVNFGLQYTSVPATCYATISGVNNGVNSAIGSFGSAVQQITMGSIHGRTTTVKAQPSGLSSDGTSFSVTWYSS